MANDKIRAYSGDKPYIFISYAHRNSDAVYPIIQRMAADGFRIWYDEGIDPGTEWDENIASHVQGCGYFLAFISPQYIESENCKDELNFARDENKERVLIYLEQTKLPSGMSMRLNRLQAIHKYVYTDEEEFFQKLYSSNGIDSFTDTPSVIKKPAPAPVTPPPKNTTTTTPKTTTPPRTTGTTTKTPTVSITNVRAIGSNGELWPEGSYSAYINRDTYPCLCFHIDLKDPPKTAKLSYTLKVYDSYNNIVLNVNSSIDWKDTYCRISKVWNINKSGSVVKPGEYRVVATVENSAAFSCNITITANTTTNTTNNTYNPYAYSNVDYDKIKKLRRKLSYPKALLWMILSFVSIIFFGIMSSRGAFGVLLGLAAAITMLVVNVRYTKRNIVNSGIGAFLLCTIGFMHYGIFVLIMAIITKVNESQYKRELMVEESKLR